VTLAERRCRGDEHEPKDHGGEYGTNDGTDPGSRQHHGVTGLVGHLLYSPLDGLPHVDVAGECGADQGEATGDHVAMQ